MFYMWRGRIRFEKNKVWRFINFKKSIHVWHRNRDYLHVYLLYRTILPFLESIFGMFTPFLIGWGRAWPSLKSIPLVETGDGFCIWERLFKNKIYHWKFKYFLKDIDRLVNEIWKYQLSFICMLEWWRFSYLNHCKLVWFENKSLISPLKENWVHPQMIKNRFQGF
jgi:hypothetical protein